MINQREWLRTRKKLLDQVKAQVQVRVGPQPMALRRYAKSLASEFKGHWRVCPDAELQRDLRSARVILGADFHAYGQSQRAHVRVLRGLDAASVVLALECLRPTDEPAVRRYLNDEISEARFLTDVKWDKNWGFPWEHYRPLFELARDCGFQIKGLNQPRLHDLRKRDDFAAKRIAAICKRHPTSFVYVIMGEMHLAKSHLPKALRRALPARDRIVVLFQDAESLYFRLANRGREDSADVMTAGDGRYCVFVSPPWMKWQSYLMFLEHAYDRDLQEDPAIDYTDHVASLIELLETDLGVQTRRKTRIQVYCPNARIPLSRLKVNLPRSLERSLLYHVENELSFYLPERDWLYLSRPTINHASTLAGQFVHAHFCRRSRALWRMPRDFLALIWIEAVGFFFSKWINPKRKAETLDSLRMQLLARHPKDRGREALLLALDHRLSEVVWVQTGRARKTRFRPRGSGAYFEAARMVGGMLGERLFQSVRSRTLSLRQLEAYLKADVEKDGFAKAYWRIVAELEHDQTP